MSVRLFQSSRLFPNQLSKTRRAAACLLGGLIALSGAAVGASGGVAAALTPAPPSIEVSIDFPPYLEAFPGGDIRQHPASVRVIIRDYDGTPAEEVPLAAVKWSVEPADLAVIGAVVEQAPGVFDVEVLPK
ncbi:MAG: hypothetical protein LBH76_01135, partial [Propionibacteriaceae bacterium]|nr:hypothetical protein [Propionibacteriaceae bacterium]